MSLSIDSRIEMQCYCNYLLGKEADEHSLGLFEKAAKQDTMQLLPADEKLLNFVIENTWALGMVDAALGLFYPKHVLRRRLITAFAILETNPLYFSFFKPKQFSSIYLFQLSGAAMVEGIKAIAGRIILFFV